MDLFHLLDPDTLDAATQEYFQRQSYEKFWELLEQVADISPKQDQFLKWIQKRCGIVKPNEENEKVFKGWNEQSKNQSKWGQRF